MPEVMREVSICDLCDKNKDRRAPCRKNGRHEANKKAMSRGNSFTDQGCDTSVVKGLKLNLFSYIDYQYGGRRKIEMVATERE